MKGEELVIIVNFKTYERATGEDAVRLARACALVARERNADIRVAVQAADIYRVASQVAIPVYAEHVDPINPGRNTGFILPEDVKREGAVGTLLNHSEHRLDPDTLARAVQEARGAGLRVIICAKNAEEAASLSLLSPEFVAVEPPVLIGGEVSVSTAKPGLIRRAARLVKAPLLVGAGIHDSRDVRTALSLGARGVLVASCVTRAPDPRLALERLLDF